MATPDISRRIAQARYISPLTAAQWNRLVRAYPKINTWDTVPEWIKSWVLEAEQQVE